MPSGYRSGGVDFDDLFDPDVVGDGPTVALPGMRSGGTPLRYAALAYGTKRANVGYRGPNGQDVSNLWAAKGTAQYRLPFDGQVLTAGISAQSGETGMLSATATFVMQPDGTYVGRASGRGTVVILSGTWLPAGSSVSDWQVQYAWQNVAGNASPPSNGAPSYSDISTARTAARSATVQANTSDQVSGSADLLVRIRRNGTGQVLEGTLRVNVSALGFA